MKNNLANGTTMQAINNTNIKKIKILSPTEDILNNFNRIVKPIFKQIYENNIENKNLIQLRDILLPKLMSGEIDVSNVKTLSDKTIERKRNYSKRNYKC
jgi:type I restriction enzyme S subunit